LRAEKTTHPGEEGVIEGQPWEREQVMCIKKREWGGTEEGEFLPIQKKFKRGKILQRELVGKAGVAKKRSEDD